MSVQGFYRGGNGNPNISLDALVTAVAGIFGGTAGGNVTEQATYDLFDNNITSLNNADTEFFDGNEDVAAYLNYIIFDKDFVESRSGFIPMDGDAYEIPMLMSNSIVSPVEGFIYIYLTNESNAEAYFDDFEVTVKESAIVQNTDYYPFGLSHNTSWTRPTDLKNNYLYNAGSELNEMTKNYETFYRNYDPAIGRFNGVDIMATAYHSASPYSFANNDPVYFNDPMGDMPQAFLLDMMVMNMDGARDPVYNSLPGMSGSGSIGPGSGNHWSDQYRSVEGNMALMSTNDFRNFYGLNDGFGGTNYEIAGQLANTIAAGQSSSERKSSFEQVLGVDLHNRHTHDGMGAIIPFIAVTQDGKWIGNMEIDFYQQGSPRPYSRTDTGDGLIDGVSQGLTAAGAYGTARELALLDQGLWKSPKNGNWYPVKNQPNGTTGPKSATMKAAGKWGALSRGTFYVGALVSLYQLGNNPSWAQAGQSGTDIGFGYLGAYGGVPGALLSAGYFADQVLRHYSPSYSQFQNTQSMLNQQYRAYDVVCFEEGTKIYSENGFVSIQDLKVGMRVFTYNFDIDSVELKPIMKFFTKEVHDAYELDLGGEMIVVTAEHPFYVNEKWIKVKDLKTDDLLTALDGEVTRIKSIKKLKKTLKVYNIEVSGNHNYYVSISRILVHNKNIVEFNDSEEDMLKQEIIFGK